MAKRSRDPVEIPPDLTKEQGRQALLVMKDKGEKLLANRPIPAAAFDTWTDSTIEYIEKTFGSRSNHINNFIGQIQIQVVSNGDAPDERYTERRRAEQLE